jgi:two-component system OmpR family response regulator
MTEQPKILIVEDDRNLAEIIAYNLRKEGYRTDTAHTGLEAIIATRTQPPDLLLLDIMLPELDGFEVCRTIRASSSVPIIILTARDDEMDRVLGLELGADDYIIKPFSLRELLARIRALLRRVELGAQPDKTMRVLEFGGLQVRPESRTVLRDGVVVQLLPREFSLLLYLMQNRGLVLSREQLLENVWGVDYYGDTRTVDVHIRRLRLKIERDPSHPRVIRTVYGLGYTFQGDQMEDKVCHASTTKAS